MDGGEGRAGRVVCGGSWGGVEKDQVEKGRARRAEGRLGGHSTNRWRGRPAAAGLCCHGQQSCSGRGGGTYGPGAGDNRHDSRTAHLFNSDDEPRSAAGPTGARAGRPGPGCVAASRRGAGGVTDMACSEDRPPGSCLPVPVQDGLPTSSSSGSSRRRRNCCHLIYIKPRQPPPQSPFCSQMRASAPQRVCLRAAAFAMVAVCWSATQQPLNNCAHGTMDGPPGPRQPMAMA